MPSAHAAAHGRASLALGPPCMGIELAWLDWGPSDAGRVVVCVHGLTRNAHDFDVLAASLAAAGARVLAVDMVGRGRSSWLADPRAYIVPAYVAHMRTFLATLGLDGVDWIGTSMGGLIGMALAAADGSPIRRLVLNDIGPFVAKDALQQIAAYLGQDQVFASLADLEVHLRLIHAGFGHLDDAQWRAMALASARPSPEGWRLHYDPRIRIPYLSQAAADIELWDLWDRITCPTFLLRGAASPLLSPATALAMTRRGPSARLSTIEGAGHAPALTSEAEVAIIAGWLELERPA